MSVMVINGTEKTKTLQMNNFLITTTISGTREAWPNVYFRSSEIVSFIYIEI